MTVLVAGSSGLVGSAVVRAFESIDVSVTSVNRQVVDLLNPIETEEYIRFIKPSIVVDAAAKVGGIIANNTLRADFIYRNLMIECNLIHAY